MKEPIIQELAQKHSIEPGNVLLSYLNNRGIVVLPKSVTPSRIEKNLKVVDLGEEDVERLNRFAKDSGKLKRFCNPPWGVDFKVSCRGKRVWGEEWLIICLAWVGFDSGTSRSEGKQTTTYSVIRPV
jgi:hypothetical protein